MDTNKTFQSLIKAAEITSRLPSAIQRTRFEKTCVIVRIEEVLAICRDNGLNPRQIRVTCSPDLARKLGFLAPIDEISVRVFANPKRLDEVDCGSFSIEISGFCCGASELSISFTGIAYSSPVAVGLHEIRWTLQVVDGKRPKDAQQNAKLLFGSPLQRSRTSVRSFSSSSLIK